MTGNNRAGLPTLCLATVLLLLDCGCGRPSEFHASGPQAPVYVNISPKSLSVKRGASVGFAVTVINAKDATVNWSISEGSAGGGISTSGVYTAPNIDGDYHVVATSKEDPTKSATASVSVGSDAFTATGQMAYARSGHTATLLTDGRVLVAGGFGLSGIESHAEIFDPVQGVFHTAGTMTRVGHTATRLMNGDVLFAGGVTDISLQTQVATVSAEIFNSATGLFQPTGNMIVPRKFFAATLLQDGRLLITGGITANEAFTNTAELYDPKSGTFSLAARMNYEWFYHSATLLTNGKVLLAGSGDAELYDPATDSFRIINGVQGGGGGVAKTLLSDGRVLITGGISNYASMYVGPSEIFDPVTEHFSFSGALTLARWEHTATLLPNGSVLIAGGSVDAEADDLPTDTTEIYDPAKGTFSPGPEMLYPLSGHSATTLSDGSVLITGGAGQVISAAAQIFD
jgi:hypothetical protein